MCTSTDKARHRFICLMRVLLLIVIAGIGLSSCGSGSNTPDYPIMLTILVGFGTGTDQYQLQIHQQLAQEFNASHHDINIRFETVNYAEHDTKFAAMLVDGNPPDLVMPIGVAGIATYYHDWLDLAPLIGKEAGLEDDLYPKVLAANQYGKHLYGLPLGLYPAVLYYNVDMFDRAKIPYPTHHFGEKNWTYDQAFKIAASLTRDKNGKLPQDKGFDPEAIIRFGYDFGDWLPLRALVAKFDPAATGLSPDLKTAQMDSNPWKTALRTLHDSILTHPVRPRGNGTSTIDTFGDNDPLGSNRTAMWESFSWIQYAFSAWNSNFNWDVGAVPAQGTNPPVVPCNTESIAIPLAAKHPYLSWEVAKWMLKSEVLTRLSTIYGCIPARKSLGTAWISEQKKINPNVDWQVFLDSTAFLDKPNHESWLPNYKKIQDSLQSLMAGVSSGTITDTDQAAASLNHSVQSFLDEYWKLQP